MCLFKLFFQFFFLLVSVGLHVPIQIIFLRGSVRAERTLVGSFPRVCADVTGEAALQQAGVGAVAAAVVTAPLIGRPVRQPVLCVRPLGMRRVVSELKNNKTINFKYKKVNILAVSRYMYRR